MLLNVLRFALLSVTTLFSSPAFAEWFYTSQDIMGTQVVVDVWHDNENIAQHCSDKVIAEMNRIDNLLSPYKAESELAVVNKDAALKDVEISDEFFDLIKKSLEMSEISKGAFDITFASVGYLYDYRNKQRPSEQTINSHLSAINYKNIVLNDKQKSIRFALDGVRIDLGGIAKGYAVDNGIAILKQCGIKNGLVSAGGDSRILGNRNGRPWVMGVRHPRNKKDVVVKLPLSNTAISTSGDYERYFIEDDKRYHHIIQPDTGKSVSTIWSVTVMANDAVLTDALSTTLFVLGVKEGMALIDQYKNVDAIIIDAKGKMHYSSGLVSPGKNH